MTTINEIPLGLPGRVYRSPMPFSNFDIHGDLFKQYLEKGISVVVLLVEDGDCLAKAGRKLRTFYIAQELQVIYLPIPDFHIPDREILRNVVLRSIEEAKSGKNLVVHCHAGLGRTGMFLACMAKEVLGISGHEAIAWVRQWISPRAVETAEQERLVLEF